ncbi:hypothetical protein JX265_001891 [Neoarthrinium moseri]|uniref:Uncharacterized protein n=1 Tax=Neoarthrinium moseri TaxID=1658444 RepID=A0A9P9WW03_9PEZI|nr:hypothetical protein JX265_001891 [Neoarthrinium moseri]
MRAFILIAVAAAAVSATPMQERADGDWQVTRFAAYVAAHSIVQHITFSVTVPGIDAPIPCSNATGAAISSSPFLLPVQGGTCSKQDFSFNFRQVENAAIELEVKREAGPTATYNSPSDVVQYVTTGSTPLDTGIAYVGAQDFGLRIPK